MTFLKEEQIEHLEEYGWDVIPDCAHINLYKDEIEDIVWIAICQELGVDISSNYVKILCIGKQ